MSSPARKAQGLYPCPVAPLPQNPLGWVSTEGVAGGKLGVLPAALERAAPLWASGGRFIGGTEKRVKGCSIKASGIPSQAVWTSRTDRLAEGSGPWGGRFICSVAQQRHEDTGRARPAPPTPPPKPASAQGACCADARLPGAG